MEDLFLIGLKLLWELLIAAIEAAGRAWKWLIAPVLTSAKRNLAESWREVRSQTWRLGDGAVEHLNIEEHFTEWRLEIAYSYEVGGELFSGYLMLPFANTRDVEVNAALLPCGEHLVVRIHPGRSDRATLLLRDQAMFQHS